MEESQETGSWKSFIVIVDCRLQLVLRSTFMYRYTSKEKKYFIYMNEHDFGGMMIIIVRYRYPVCRGQMVGLCLDA